MSSYDLDRIRAAMQVPWDAQREKRVLEGVLRLLARRARRKRALEWTMAAAAALLVFRALPRIEFANDEKAPSFGSSAIRVPETPQVPSPIAADGGVDQGGTGGFAGARNHGRGGGGGLAGNGGRAGTS